MWEESRVTAGILAYGAYIPWRRLQRKSIVDAHQWFNPALRAQGKGERAMCNWDEDVVTMAVEAARDALASTDRATVAGLRLASTTFPFLDRQHASLVAEALDLAETTATSDSAASQRAGTSALIDALTQNKTTLVLASENRRTRAASPMELSNGDGAAALLVGEGTPIATLLAAKTRMADFVDHFRSMENVFDYQWEERWIRDAGFMTLMPGVIADCLAAAGVAAKDVTTFCFATPLARVSASVAKAVGLSETALCDPIYGTCGDTGVAHPLLLLAAALEQAKPGDKILVAGFGQGADALLFAVTDAIGNFAPRLGVRGHLARRKAETNYTRFLAFNDIIELERGMRAEADKLTPLSALWRNRDTVTRFRGGQCTTCGTLQFPRSAICVNPNCHAIDTQEPYSFAETTGRINSYTADRLTYTPDPPACYGMIQFEEGGRWMMDFTDVDDAELAVGKPMRMMFRIKDVDPQRGFRRYFWKAAPLADAPQEA
jgi:hydroxymethylglutaryl-CoA synthase